MSLAYFSQCSVYSSSLYTAGPLDLVCSQSMRIAKMEPRTDTIHHEILAIYLSEKASLL